MDTLSWVTLSLATATFLLAGAAFWSIWQNYTFKREERCIQAMYRIRAWAEQSSQLLTVPSPSGQDEALAILRKNIQIVRASSLGALADGDALGGEVNNKVQKAVHDFDVIVETAKTHNLTDFEDLLRNLLLDYWEVIKSTSKL